MNDSITITRVFDAPIEKVWNAWTDGDLIRRWWGPKDFSCPAAMIDFQVGGKYLFCMRGAAGPGAPVMDFWSTGIYKEIVPLQKIVCTDSFADEKGNIVPATYYGMPSGETFPLEMEVTVTFEKDGNKTKMTLVHVGHPAGLMSDMATQGWNQSLDKMAASF